VRAAQQQRQFTAGDAHELRTPLSVVKSTLQLARSRDRTSADYRRAIDEALSDLHRIEGLIDQLLVLARMDETEGIARAAPVPLDVLLADLAERYDQKAMATGGRVACEAMPPTVVRGDEDLLGRLFGNLLDNAIRHGPPGGTVGLSLSGQADGPCVVTVRDEGGRIPPEILARLFDRFYRADSSRNHSTGGTGLGLAIARQIARRHGGEVSIESSPAKGTVVTVRLPRLEATREPAAAPA